MIFSKQRSKTMTKILIYDCEIINCIPPINNPNLSYCKGWNDFKGMGISVIGTWRNYDTLNPFGKYEAFVNETNLIEVGLTHLEQFERFQQLADQADLIIGFNSISFDDKLCKANGINIQTDLDVLIQVRRLTGQGSGFYQYGVTRKGYSLKDIARENLTINKSLSGELAPVQWQKGFKKQVIDYCLLDVKILKQIYFKMIKNKLVDPEEGDLIIWDKENYEKFDLHYEKHLNWVRQK
jgi:hypothetical protein